MSWLLTMVIWAIFGGLYAAAFAFAAHHLARRYVWRRFTRKARSARQ